MVSPAIDNAACNTETESLDGAVSAMSASGVKSEAYQLLGVENWSKKSTSAQNVRISGPTIATESLVYLSSGLLPSAIQRTLSHDLQSFCWVIIYVAFKHTIEELKGKSISAIKGIAEFNKKTFDEEFNGLFAATSATNLATKRKVAFQSESGTGEALAYAGIENLHNYVESKDVALAAHLRIIWHFLKNCEPLQTMGVDKKSNADHMALMREAGNAPVQAAAPDVQLSPFSITFNHANLIRVLEVGIREMADSEQAAST
ncbi:uncharacterized protein TRAVEDRAFT_17046 [Trametes versicolor FP-101664 SS1]|uniref:uncharacterized protein n=1 Tax=Trametes versicolor (strain FP-101664) TaxID=717944 RepID=UPI0004622463|nr:uncharacterized protein TRAVEDRAFT_17046 [Trametes versicolor FP-101664 SS1]EIW65279.1 hypothetical protein TRAVEDRAFT_17046 [Trametes versicolor FP-101664 SS1]